MRDASVEPTITGFSLTRYNTLLVVVAGLASAAFLYFGTGLHPIWWLLWVAPVPVLAISPRLRGSAAFLLGSIAWFLGEMNQWNYLRHVVALPLRIIILAFVVAPVVFGLGVLFTRSFPAAWLAFPRGPVIPCLLGNLRISQRDFIASQHMGQSRLHASKLSSLDSDRFGYWSLGNQLRCLFVCQYGRGTLQRRRRTLATSCVGNRSRMRGLRSICLWHGAVGVEAFG